MSSAVATGACSRTTASTIAAPSWDWAPICWRRDPTSSAMTMPKGIDTRISGRVVTRARNQHWSKNSATGRPAGGELPQRLEGQGEHAPGLADPHGHLAVGRPGPGEDAPRLGSLGRPPRGYDVIRTPHPALPPASPPDGPGPAPVRTWRERPGRPGLTVVPVGRRETGGAGAAPAPGGAGRHP